MTPLNSIGPGHLETATSMVATYEPNLSGFPQSSQTVWYYELTDFTYYDFTVSPWDSTTDAQMVKLLVHKLYWVFVFVVT